MRSLRRFGLVAAALLLAAGGDARAQSLPRLPSAGAPAAPRPETDGPSSKPKSSLPSVRIGALLPLSGTSAWFGKEMRQGMELAIADLDRAPDPDAPPALAAEPGVHLALEAADVSPLNLKQATEAFARLAATGAPVIFTASATPTVTVQPLAAARDVLLVHLGLVTERLASASRTLIHARAPIAARVEALVAYAAERQVRRLALLAAGDEFGKAVRAALAASWRERGAALVHEESVSLDAPDLAARLRRLVRVGPDAVVLGFRGADLGDLALRLREAGYAGPLALLDDDPIALLAAGPGLQNAAVIADAFRPEPGSAGARFTDVYTKKFGSAPSGHAATAYDAVTLVAAGLRQAMAERGGPPGGGRLRDVLLARRRFDSVYGGELRLRDDGTVSRPLALFSVDGGQLTFVRYLAPGKPA
ncbi:MAG TPA: ABC transporter substrate-binding protein [Methylomirabilota bacterium]|jgi:branched-chain amino acid transport system substrate-binding protein|nr:ABC transporter substrate-binding protein [Methylomirabilota bacterium]